MDPREADPAWLQVEEAECVARAVDKRRREFAAGRGMARKLLRRLGVEHEGPLLPGPKREPCWPSGIVGTISHTDGWAAVAMAKADACGGLGADVERDTPLKPEIIMRICIEEERRWLARWDDPTERGHWGKVIFSAKETAYKAQYPRSNRFLGFEAMAVALDLDAQTFEARFCVEAPPFRVGDTFTGRFRCAQDLIATGICLPVRP